MTPPSKSKLLSGFTVAAAMLLPVLTASGASVHATLIGDEVTASISDGSVWPQSPAIVDASVEFELVLANVTFTADIGSNEITLTYENTSQLPNITIPPLNFLFSDLNWTGMPGSVVTSVVPLSNNFPGLIASSVTSDSMTLHMPLTNTNPADRFFTSFRIDAQVIPEPPDALITGMGLLLIAWQARGRRYVRQARPIVPP